jgi:hypothetical protein
VKTDQIEVRTRSVPTAAALITLGFEPTRIIYRDHGGPLLVFAAEARVALAQFMANKTRVDGMLEEAAGLR